MPPTLLSKSKYMDGLQCIKYLWTEFHEPRNVSPPDGNTLHNFEQGHEVGELARKLFPGGIDIPDESFTGNIRKTRELLKQRRTVFEAGITAGRVYARVDILRPAGKEEWDIIEVKSSTRVKDTDIQDVAFQRYCCQQAGLEIRNCFLVHINNGYVRHGVLELDKLFVMEDVTEQVAEVFGNVPDNVAAMFEIIDSADCPEIGIGRHCESPYVCMVGGCRDFLPEDNVLELNRGGQKCFDLLASGVLAICEIPEDFKLTGNQRIQKTCVVSGLPHLNKPLLQGFLAGLKYPVYYFDFETFATAIPLFEGTRPYQNIPFQFSVHVTTDARSQPEQSSFLAEGTEDPRPALLAALKLALGESGSIVVYNASFEKGILEELGQAFPEYAAWVAGVNERLVDLYPPFRSFWYYHPSQKGSASLKAVLPAVTERGYDGLGISKGDIASFEYYRVTYTDVPEEERRRVRQDLEAYCGRDTEGMIWIVDALGKA